MSSECNFRPGDGHGPRAVATWAMPRNGCFERCVEVRREAQAADELRALVARMVDVLPAGHPLAAAARDILE